MWEADAEHAQEVLRHESVPAGAEGGQAVPEGSVCPVHEVPATIACARCGGFNCERCPTFGNPAICEDCAERESQASRPAADRRRVWVKAVAALLLLPSALALALLIVMSALRLLGVVGR